MRLRDHACCPGATMGYGDKGLRSDHGGARRAANDAKGSKIAAKYLEITGD